MATNKLRDIVAEAVKNLSEFGYDSDARVEDWKIRIAKAMKSQYTGFDEIRRKTSTVLEDAFFKALDNREVAKAHKDLPLFTIEQVKPQLRAELDRRIIAAADLIKINKEEMVERTLRRFQGWATSIPNGGSEAVEKRKVAANISAPLSDQTFLERRVHIDQAHKLVSNINDITAKSGGAIAGIWSSRFRQAGYDYRQEHKDRDGKVYLIRDNWAQQQGLVKVGAAGYMDEITMPGEEVFCRCSYIYLYSLRKMPDDMLTAKGREKVAA